MINLIFILLIGMCLSFEIHKSIKFKMFYRINMISVYYGKNITKKLNSNILLFFSKMTLIDIIYTLLTLIGLFTINSNLFLVLICMSFIKTIVFKYIKNKIFIKAFIFFDSFFSIPILTIIIINLLFYKIPDILLLTNIYNIIF